MDENAANSEEREVAPTEQSQENNEQEIEQVSRNSESREEIEERNWRAMRQKNEDLQRRLKNYEDMHFKMLEKQVTSSAEKKEEIDEFDQIADDDYIPKGKVEKLIEKRAQKYAEAVAKRQVESYYERQQQDQFLTRLKAQFSDFDDVVNTDTLSILETQEPELAKSIMDLKDPYKIGVHSYKYIKAMQLSKNVHDNRRKQETEKAIRKSENSIQSPAAFDKRPMAQAFQMTEQMKSDLYKEMTNAAKFASSVPEIS